MKVLSLLTLLSIIGPAFASAPLKEYWSCQAKGGTKALSIRPNLKKHTTKTFWDGRPADSDRNAGVVVISDADEKSTYYVEQWGTDRIDENYLDFYVNTGMIIYDSEQNSMIVPSCGAKFNVLLQLNLATLEAALDKEVYVCKQTNNE